MSRSGRLQAGQVRLGAIFACVLLLAPGATTASAQSTRAQDALSILDMDGIMDADGIALRVHALNETDAELSDVRVELTVHARTRSRFALSSAVDEGRVGRVLGRSATPAMPLRPGVEARLRATATADELGLAGAPAGVYPLTVDLLAADELLGRSLTAIVVPPSGGEPLRLATVLDTHGPVALRTDGLDDDALDAMAERILDVVEAVGDDLPATLLVDGRTVDELAGHMSSATGSAESDDQPTPLEALQEVARRPDVEIAPYPYGPADLVAIVRDGRADLAERLVDRARAVAAQLDGQGGASPVVAVAAGLDDRTARWLARTADATVLSESTLGLPLRRDFPATPPSVRRLLGVDDLRVVVPDPLMAEALDRTADEAGPVLTAQRILAETAAVFFERPGSDEPRGFVLAPSPDLGRTLLPLLAETLDSASWLTPTTLSGLLGDVPVDGEPETLVYTPRQRADELPADYLDDVEVARAQLAPLRSILGGDDLDGLDRQLDTITAVEFREPMLRAVGEAVAGAPLDTMISISRSLTVVEPPQVTLTGTEGTVPVTVDNTSERDLLVGIRLLTTRYAVGDIEEPLVLPARTAVTTTFDVRALAPGGRYPIIVDVTDPDGSTVLASGQVVVRSTASNIAGLLVTGGAVVFLAAWGLRGLARRRRRGGVAP